MCFFEGLSTTMEVISHIGMERFLNAIFGWKFSAENGFCAQTAQRL
jgi:hypothetical protein